MCLVLCASSQGEFDLRIPQYSIVCLLDELHRLFHALVAILCVLAVVEGLPLPHILVRRVGLFRLIVRPVVHIRDILLLGLITDACRDRLARGIGASQRRRALQWFVACQLFGRFDTRRLRESIRSVNRLVHVDV